MPGDCLYKPKQRAFRLAKKHSQLNAILGYRRDVDKNCAALGYYAVSGGNLLPTFLDNIDPSSGVKNGTR